MRCISIVKSLYFKIFSASFLITFLLLLLLLLLLQKYKYTNVGSCVAVTS
jgi:hypothetical protein